MLGGWFQEDDYDILNHVAKGGPFGMWSVAPTYFFRPVISLTFWAQYRLWGLDPIPYRIFNDLVHAGVATALALLVKEVLAAWHPEAQESNELHRSLAIAAGLLFVFHPSHAEAVNWIAARTDLLSALFGLLSLWAFVRYLRTDNRPFAACSLVTFALGLLCKESVLLVPFIAAAYTWMRRERRAWPLLVGLGGVTVGYFALRVALIGTEMKGNLERAHGAKLIAATVTEAARTLLPGLPFGDPNLNNVETVRTPAGIAYLAVGILLLAAVALMAIRCRKQRPPVVFFAVAFLLAVAPAAGLSVRLFRSQGERFIYLPSAFLIAAVAILIAQRGKDLKLRWLLPTLLTCFALLQWQNIIWKGGAALSQRIQRSFIQDVVDQAGPDPSNIALVDVPVAVQGSYSLGYVFPSVASLFRPGREHNVDVVSALLLRSPDHKIRMNRQGPLITLTSPDDTTRFSLEATGTGRKLDPNHLEGAGYAAFGPSAVVFDLRSLRKGTEAFFWDGNRFQRLAR